LTGTVAAQAENASATLTFPRAIRCLLRLSVMLLEWTVITVTVKSAVLVAEPLGVVTLILPVVAPAGTVAVICVPVAFTVKVVALTLLKLTAVAPVKPVPVIFTTVPTGPEVGVKDVMVTQEPTVKSAVLVAAAPTGVSTLIFPVVAPEGTIAVIVVALTARVEVAVVVLNLTKPALSDASRRFVPVIVTDVPADPHVGVNELMVGAQVPGSATSKLVALTPVAVAFVT
jgi:hypothetical protein